MPEKTDRTIPKDAPQISEAQRERLRAAVLANAKEPLFLAGTVTRCQQCNGDMVTTNDLERLVPTPRGLVVITRLPGAQCTRCDAVQFDAGALRLILQHSRSEIAADYETKVTRASGKTLGVYLKADLARVMNLRGKEKMAWKVLDRNHALVEIERGTPSFGEPPATEPSKRRRRAPRES
ncbi:MAG TPA: hypothetical protein VGB18_00580 [Candidatus Thermoplasmatota archaeon]